MQTNFNGADFSYVHWINSQFISASWDQTKWFNCKITNLQLAGSDFNKVHLENIKFLNCDSLESTFQAVKVKK